jgi:hypothetical protein
MVCLCTFQPVSDSRNEVRTAAWPRSGLLTKDSRIARLFARSFARNFQPENEASRLVEIKGEVQPCWGGYDSGHPDWVTATARSHCARATAVIYVSTTGMNPGWEEKCREKHQASYS